MMEMCYQDRGVRSRDGVHASQSSAKIGGPGQKHEQTHGFGSSTKATVKGEIGGNVGVDELLANAGYNVRASELAQVAQRLEQLETALVAAREAGISHLSTEAVHYNPSDLAGWVECMLGELNPSEAAGDGHLQINDDIHASVAGSRQNIDPCSATKQWPFEAQSEVANAFEEFPDHDFLQEYMALQYSSSDESNMKDLYTGLVFSPADQAKNQMEKQQSEQCMVCPPSATSGIYSEDCSFQSSDDSEQFSHSNGHFAQAQNRITPQQLPVVMDGGDFADDSGVRLVHLILACAEAVQRNDLVAADEMVRVIRVLSAPECGPMGRVATQFAEALARRIYGCQSQESLLDQSNGDSFSELLHLHFYESCPYLKFAHFTSNQAILEAFEGCKQVHVIDFNLMHGLQWPALIQALALRPGGPPFLRITGIAPPQPGNNEMLKEIGMKLAQLARSVEVEFDFRGVVAARLNDLKPWMLQVREGEAVAVNAAFQMHRLLYSNNPTKNPIDEVLQCVRSLNPRIVTIVEQEANHNSPIFLERFTEALHYYSTMFDSLEACNLPPQSLQQVLAESYLGKEICNIVACEGEERVERHETLAQWRARMRDAGFQPLHLGSNAFKQASMLLTLFSSREGYVVEENGGCLTLGWHSRPLVAASAWKCNGYTN
ncbi:hypothetical protein O6H91_13G010800 [Diphasiastrum complanatum]|uniref:Uncharacterized protein n=1 Tax=Diphasiastrum complanatum TaxID=34168 RepID=A0ACC2BSC6_DIPCM|nr:hypothetical protein O6H91_13G010800 [Diphasiastrum complanatum]